MTNKQFLKLQQALLIEFPEFTIEGGVLRLPSEECLLTGIYFGSSSYTKEKFYVGTFVLALFVPHEHLAVNYGARLRIDGTFDGWRSDDPELLPRLKAAITSQALPFLRSVGSLSNFILFMRTEPPFTRNLQNLGYALAKIGSTKEAREVIGRIGSTIKDFYKWEVDLLLETTTFHDLLISDPLAAQKHLTEIEHSTRLSLKLSPSPERP